MKLTRDEELALEGKKGEGVRIAYSILYQLGLLYGAERFIPVSQAHIDGCSYTTVWDAGIEFAEKLHHCGARASVPATLNITSRDIENWKELKIDKEFAARCERLETAYLNLGCIPTWSCTPYLNGNPPNFGENIAWAESNAVNYANSVCGARTNRYGDMVDMCCAVAGAAPEFGLHLKENRAGQILFKVRRLKDRMFADSSAFAVLGYMVGLLTGDKIPVIDGLPAAAAHDDLKAFSAASAASGAVALFHAVGLTPEAPTIEAAFQGRKPESTIDITPDSFKEAKRALTSAKRKRADLVVIGCPHASYMELWRVLELMGGQRVKKGVEFWIQTSRYVKTLAERSGMMGSLEKLGVKVIQDTCINNFSVSPWGFSSVVTNSGKMAHYAPGNTGADVVFLNLQGCVKAAVSGEVDDI